MILNLLKIIIRKKTYVSKHFKGLILNLRNVFTISILSIFVHLYTLLEHSAMYRGHPGIILLFILAEINQAGPFLLGQ